MEHIRREWKVKTEKGTKTHVGYDLATATDMLREQLANTAKLAPWARAISQGSERLEVECAFSIDATLYARWKRDWNHESITVVDPETEEERTIYRFTLELSVSWGGGGDTSPKGCRAKLNVYQLLVQAAEMLEQTWGDVFVVSDDKYADL